MTKRLRLTFPSDISNVDNWMLYVESNIFPDINHIHVNRDSSTPPSLALPVVAEMRHRGIAMQTILRNRLENKRRDQSSNTSKTVETYAETVYNDILRIHDLFDSFRNEIYDMAEASHKKALDRTFVDIVKRSNARMIPATASQLENQRSLHLHRIQEKRSSLSIETINEQNRGKKIMCSQNLLYFTVFFFYSKTPTI